MNSTEYYNYNKHVGERYGNLIIIGFDHERRTPNGTLRRYMKCKCECGNTCVVALHSLKSGKTKSCGCIKGVAQRGYKYNYPHLYPVYDNIVKRCYKFDDSQYKYYGARGVKMCDEWLNDRNAFYYWAVTHGYKDGLQIDRIDSNKNYCPENCRFVTAKENSRNKRNNRIIYHNGKKYVFSEFCEIFNINNRRSALYRYVKKGYTSDELIKWGGGISATTCDRLR